MYDSKYNLKGAIVCGSVLSIATYANIRNIFSDTQDDAIYDPLTPADIGVQQCSWCSCTREIKGTHAFRTGAAS